MFVKSLNRLSKPRRSVEYLQIFLQARTAHFEMIQDAPTSAKLIFVEKSYDFDQDALRLAGAEQKSPLGILKYILTRCPSIVEVNEPLFLRALPLALSVVAFIRILDFLLRRRTRIVIYAIENNDVVKQVQSHLKFAYGVARFLVRRTAGLLLSSVDRVAFGTMDAQALYSEILPAPSWPESRVVLELPAAEHESACKDCSLVVFVGSFEERKGVMQLIDCWPEVARSCVGARLEILGTGPLLDKLVDQATLLSNVRVLDRPSRSSILEAFSAAKVVVLFSQSSVRWKEQLGLPILEGLSHGCEIVSSNATGLAVWLKSEGHAVLDEDAPSHLLAAAIKGALISLRKPADIKSSLPKIHSRVTVHEWFASA